jgi:prepilin-type N-terminal cleavage/methylation domain-containing protein
MWVTECHASICPRSGMFKPFVSANPDQRRHHRVISLAAPVKTPSKTAGLAFTLVGFVSKVEFGGNMGATMQATRKLYPNSKDGFTLVEVLVSMAIMAMVFSAAFGSYFLGMRIVEDAREELRASQIIQSEMEALRSLNWTDLEALPSVAPLQPTGYLINQFSKQYLSYRQVSNISGSDGTQKRVIVYVYWKNSRGVYTFQIANTIFTKGGLNDYYYRKA